MYGVHLFFPENIYIYMPNLFENTPSAKQLGFQLYFLMELFDRHTAS